MCPASVLATPSSLLGMVGHSICRIPGSAGDMQNASINETLRSYPYREPPRESALLSSRASPESEVTVLVANPPEHQLESVPLDRLHLVPPRVLRCSYCEYTGSDVPS